MPNNNAQGCVCVGYAYLCEAVHAVAELLIAALHVSVKLEYVAAHVDVMMCFEV